LWFYGLLVDFCSLFKILFLSCYNATSRLDKNILVGWFNKGIIDRVIESCIVHAILLNIFINPRYHWMKVVGGDNAIRCLMLVSQNLSKSQMFFLFKSVGCLNWSISPPFHLDSIWGLSIFVWDCFLSRVVFNCERLIVKKIPLFF
jgi:hypothetical protein